MGIQRPNPSSPAMVDLTRRLGWDAGTVDDQSFPACTKAAIRRATVRGVVIGLALGAVSLLIGGMISAAIHAYWPAVCDGLHSSIGCGLRIVGGE